MNSDISVANYDYDVIDELVGRCYDKEVNSSFLMAALYDGRGSVAGLTGSSGGSMITYRYDAYGNTTKSNNTLNNPYQYNAEYTDSSTGLQYLRARYYDSSQGRFTAKDTYLGTIPNPLSRNLYTYVENNPLNYIDPSGHVPNFRTVGEYRFRGPVSMFDPYERRLAELVKQDGMMNDHLNGLYYINPVEAENRFAELQQLAYNDVVYGPSFNNPTAPYRYDPVKNPFGEGRNASKRKEIQTKLQKQIEKRKQENYKKYCENGVSKAKDDAANDNVFDKSDIYGIISDSLTSALDAIDELLGSVGFDTEIDLGNISEKFGTASAIIGGIPTINEHIKENIKSNSSPKKVIIDIVVDSLDIALAYAVGEGSSALAVSIATGIAGALGGSIAPGVGTAIGLVAGVIAGLGFTYVTKGILNDDGNNITDEVKSFLYDVAGVN